MKTDIALIALIISVLVFGGELLSNNAASRTPATGVYEVSASPATGPYKASKNPANRAYEASTNKVVFDLTYDVFRKKLLYVNTAIVNINKNADHGGRLTALDQINLQVLYKEQERMINAIIGGLI